MVYGVRRFLLEDVVSACLEIRMSSELTFGMFGFFGLVWFPFHTLFLKLCLWFSFFNTDLVSHDFCSSFLREFCSEIIVCSCKIIPLYDTLLFQAAQPRVEAIGKGNTSFATDTRILSASIPAYMSVSRAL